MSHSNNLEVEVSDVEDGVRIEVFARDFPSVGTSKRVNGITIRDYLLDEVAEELGRLAGVDAPNEVEDNDP